jgi:hypothetical protein
MTDHKERVFAAIVFEGDDAKIASVIEEVRQRLDGIGYEFEITPHRPQRVFTPQEIEDRFVNLYLAAQAYLAKYSKKFGVALQIDPRLLYITTISAFDDIERYKSYHLERPYRDRSDAVKRSAFLTKWLCKIGAFQTRFDLEELEFAKLLDPANLDAKPALANISFAIKVSLAHLAIDCKKNRVALTPDAEFQLSYDLLYRRVNEDALLATFQKVMDLARGNDVVIAS